MCESVLSAVWWYSCQAAGMSGPARLMPSKESPAAVSQLSLLDPAGLQSGWPHLHVRRVNITESFSTLARQRCISSSCPLWTLTINLTWAPVWKGFLPELDLSKSVWLFFLAISQSTSSSTLSTCDRTSSCGKRLKSDDDDDDDDDDGDYGEHTAQTDSECHWKSEASSYKKRDTTLTAAVVTVFVFTMAKWDCFSTSTSWA